MEYDSLSNDIETDDIETDDIETDDIETDIHNYLVKLCTHTNTIHEHHMQTLFTLETIYTRLKEPEEYTHLYQAHSTIINSIQENIPYVSFGNLIIDYHNKH
jgi:hypothetical protein